MQPLLLVLLSSCVVLHVPPARGVDGAHSDAAHASVMAADGAGVRLPGLLLESPLSNAEEEEDGEQEEAADLLEHAADAAGALRMLPLYSSFAWFVPRSTFRPPRPHRLA